MADPDRLTIAADREGTIRHWGNGVVDVLGYRPEDALGRKVDLVIPPALHPWHWRGFDKAIATGAMRRPGATVKVPAVHHDGRIVAVRAELTLTHDESGAVDGACASGLRRDPAWMTAAWKPALALLGMVASIRRMREHRRHA
jgi:PAS domain S-box-containing protein